MLQIQTLAKRKIIGMIAIYHTSATDFRAVLMKDQELILCDYSEDDKKSWKNSDLEIPYKKIVEVIRMIGGKGKHYNWCLVDMSMKTNDASIKLYKNESMISELNF